MPRASFAHTAHRNCCTTRCLRCKGPKYCRISCKELHWRKSHQSSAGPAQNGAQLCGEDANTRLAEGIPCERCSDAVYCSASCLNSDFIDHAHECPLVLEEIKAEHEQQQARRVHESRTLAQALLQQGTNRMS